MFLLIDDTPSNLDGIRDRLEGLSDSGVICCSTLQRGLDAIAQYPEISTVLLDLRLPGVTNLEALEAVSTQLEKVGNRSAIVSTMSMFPVLRKDAMQHGVKMSLDTRKMIDPSSEYLSMVLAIGDNTRQVEKLAADLNESRKELVELRELKKIVESPWFLLWTIKKNSMLTGVILFLGGFFLVTNKDFARAVYSALSKFLGQ